MADTQKSIQVTVGVTVSQAQQAMADLATSTEQASTSLDNMGQTAASSSDAVSSSMTKATTSSHGFFSQMQNDIVSSLAAYDLFKKGLQEVIGFIQDSVTAAAEESGAMAIVKTNIDNAGLSYAKIGPQLDAYSKSMETMGFTQDQTAQSVSKLTLITGSYTQGVQLNQLAMDLAANKGISLEQATTSLAQVLQGAGARALLQYGLSFKDGASAADVLNELQTKVGGSAEALAGTPAGAINTFQAQWHDLQVQVGDQLLPILTQLFQVFENNLPAIISDMEAFGNAVNDTAQAFEKAWPFIEALGVGIGLYFGVPVILGMIGGLTSFGLEMIAVGGEASAMGVGIGIASTAMEAFNALLLASPWGIFIGAVGAAIAAIENLSGKVTDTYNQLEDAQQKASDTMLTLVKKSNADVEAAQATHNDKVIALAQAEHDKVVALAEAGNNSIDASLQKRVDDAQTALNKDSDATKTWADIQTKSSAQVVTGFSNVGTAGKNSATAIADAKKAFDDLTDAYTKVTEKSSDFSFKTVDDFQRFSTALQNTKENQDQWIPEMEQGFSSLDTSITSVNSTIDSLKGKLQDAESAYAAWSATSGASGTDTEQSYAQIVSDAINAKADLQKQLATAQTALTTDQNAGNSTTSDTTQITDLQAQIAQKQAIIDKGNTTQFTSDTNFEADLALLQKTSNEDALSAAVDLTTKKVSDKQAETTALEAQITQQITDAQAEHDKLVEFQTDATAEFKANITTRQKLQTSIEQPTLAATQTAVEELTTAYNNLAVAMLKTGATGYTAPSTPTSSTTVAGKRAKGGPVTAGQTYLVGEEGPELFTPGMVSGTITPNSAISAPQSNGQGTVININYPTVRNDSDINAITTAVIGALNRRDKLAKLGAYK